jgi:hypothetical protein
MKRDDFNVRIDQVRELATKYSKPELQRMVQMGLVGPQEAVMAGMMIDRIAKSAMTPPQSTVAQDVLGMAPTAAQGQMPQMPQGQMPQEQMPSPQMAADGGIMGALPYSDGVAALPTNLPDYAGGGIVAFADGGRPEDYVRASRQADAALATMPSEAGLTLPGGFKFREYAQQKPTDIKSEISALREAEREAGVDPDMYKRMREEEGATRADFAKQREEAKGAAALALASKLFQARQGQEGQMLGAGIAEASNIYGSTLKDIRNTEKDIKKTQRELLMAEDRAKRDTSGKALGAVQAKQLKLDELQTRSVDQYNDAVKTLSKIISDEKRVDIETATRMAIAELESDTRIKVETIQQRGAYGRAAMPDSQERIINKVFADLQKTNPNATYADAVAAVKSGAGTSAATLGDKAADNVKGRMQVDPIYATSLNKPGAYEAAVEAETKRLLGLRQGGGSSAPASGAASGQIDTSNPLLR